MNTYRLSGTDRSVSAIGTFQPFSAIVRATSPKEAMDKNREARYQAGRDHILYKRVEIKVGRVWSVVPMLKALEVEG